MISMSKKYITKKGHKVRLLSVDLKSKYPIIGVCTYNGAGANNEYIVQWDRDGKPWRSSYSPSLDLIEIPEWFSFKLGEKVQALGLDGTEFYGMFAGIYRDEIDYTNYPLVLKDANGTFGNCISTPVVDIRRLVVISQEPEISEAQMCEDIVEMYRR